MPSDADQLNMHMNIFSQCNMCSYLEEVASFIFTQYQSIWAGILPLVCNIRCQAATARPLHAQSQVCRGQDELVYIDQVDVPFPNLGLNLDLQVQLSLARILQGIFTWSDLRLANC